jgi:hypothetical protein
MSTPSLILVPARFKTGKLYTPLATTSGGVVLGASGDFNVTRATTATRFNSAGLIESVASGVPRLDYYTSGGTAGCPALLVEPSAQNLYQRSEDFTNAYWSKVNSSVSGNQAVAPDGTSTAGKLIMNNGILPNAANQSGFNRAEVVTSSAYRFSMFAKSAEFTGFRVRENLAAGTFLDVNLSNGTITNGDVAQFISPLAENYGNGWYRISWTSPTITNLNKYSIRVGSTGDGVSGIFVWGAQVETGSVATSYIPTTTAAVTRNADAVNLSSVSGCIGQTEGTIYAEVDVRNFISTSRCVIFISDDTTSNCMRIEYQFVGGRHVLVCNLVIGGVTIYEKIASIGTNVVNGILKIAFGYKSGNNEVYQNGAVLSGTVTGSGTFVALPNIGKINLGSRQNDMVQFNDRIRAAALYTTRLTNAELATLTTL